MFIMNDECEVTVTANVPYDVSPNSFVGLRVKNAKPNTAKTVKPKVILQSNGMGGFKTIYEGVYGGRERSCEGSLYDL